MLFLLEGQTVCGSASWEGDHLWLTTQDKVEKLDRGGAVGKGDRSGTPL